MLTASGSLASRTVAPPTRGLEEEVDSLTVIRGELDKGNTLLRLFSQTFDGVVILFDAVLTRAVRVLVNAPFSDDETSLSDASSLRG
jgi:hypothetical protein